MMVISLERKQCIVPGSDQVIAEIYVQILMRYQKDFWSNTSSNSIVSRFIDKANKQTRDEIENLISGETVIKEIKQELTYNELDKSIENLWSILFTTGYLTQRERIDSRKLRLAIPNREIKELFELQIREWFQEKSSEDVKKLDKLCMAFPDGDAETIEDLFNDYLWNTISIRDTAVKGRKENFIMEFCWGC